MAFLTVRHLTVYRYSEPVELGEHRMMFRPRESHDLRLVNTRLTITPVPVTLRWLHDVFDNSLAIATFEGETSELRFDSSITLEHFEIGHQMMREADRLGDLQMGESGHDGIGVWLSQIE